MAPSSARRGRASDSDDDDVSRPRTPASTAPNDSKRARRSLPHADETDSSASESHQLNLHTPQGNGKEIKPVLVKGIITPSSKHQTGAIVRVKLTNFVTYTSAEFFPGPNLNMVIGPNGTGKSTLVCAICLGLGWGTQYLGRGKDVSEFVKHGCREATIEIELQRRAVGPLATRRNPVITRTIKREGNKSIYLLNGNAATGKSVQTLAQSFDIQIDNLCQFLPQDKVVEFAQMSPVEILQSTQRAAAGPEMIQMHENLKRLRTVQKDLMSKNRGDREQLENLENRQEMQRTEVERLRERAVVKQKLEWLERCRPIARYADAKKKANEAKRLQKQLTADLKKLRDESGPTLRKVNAKQIYEQHVRKLKEQKDMEVASSEKKCDEIETDIDVFDTEMRDCDNSIAAERKNIQPRKAEIKRAQQALATLRLQKDRPPPDFDSQAMNQEIQLCRRRQRELGDRNTELREQKRNLLNQAQSRTIDLRELKTRLTGLETRSGQQESKLEILSRDTFKAWKWIQDNKDQFEQHVFGPPMVECSLKDPGKAIAVEALLQKGDYTIITVQNERDFTQLQRKLNHDLGLHDIRLRTCSAQDLEQFRPPLSAEEMERNGIDSWAIDQLYGPPTVLAMLCIEKGLHQCGISTRNISQEQHEHLANSTLRSYVAGNKCYQFVRRAEYGTAGSITRVRELRKPEIWTDQPVDMGRKARLEREISEKQGENAIVREELLECDKEMAQNEVDRVKLESEIGKITEEKEAKQLILVEWRKIDAKIQREMEKQATAQEYLDGMRDRVNTFAAKKDLALLNKADTVLRYAAATKELKECFASLLEAEVMCVEALSDFQVLKARNEHIVKLLEQKSAEEKEAVATSRKQVEEAKELVVMCKKLRDESVKLEADGDPSLTNLLQELGEKQLSVDDLEAEIDSQKAQLELTEGGNADAIREFEEREKKIESLRALLTAFNTKQADLKHAIAEVRGKWEPELEKLVERISDAFSDSFARIGCAGQVAIHKACSDDPADCTEENSGAENGLDFTNWAIHISVKFRENEPLSLLDSHRQSGGERAVSTIFYLMALQSLSRAPFRVVDEINQGMDPRNERMVHGRMVDIAADEGGSQYFLITPKLLSGLKYARGMTVLCIVSGENMPGAKIERDGRLIPTPKVDFRAFARKARELGLSHAEGRGTVEWGAGLSGILVEDAKAVRVAEVGA